MKTTAFVITLLLILVMPASAAHYQIKDSDGNVIYDVDITHAPEVPNLGAFYGLSVSVNGGDNKPISGALVNIEGFNDTEIVQRSVAGTTQTGRGLFLIDLCINNTRTRDKAEIAVRINGKGPLIYSHSTSHRFPQADTNIVSAMCGAFSNIGMASASVGGCGEWRQIGNINIAYAVINSQMDANANAKCGYWDTSVAGSGCANAAGVQTTTATTRFVPEDGGTLPSLYTASKSSSLTAEAGINGQLESGDRQGSASATASLYCPSGDAPIRLSFHQSETRDNFGDGGSDSAYISKQTVISSGDRGFSEFVTGNASGTANITVGQLGGEVTFAGHFTNNSELLAGVYSKPAVTEQ